MCACGEPSSRALLRLSLGSVLQQLLLCVPSPLLSPSPPPLPFPPPHYPVMSGMEFGDRDLMPGEAMSGATEWEDALIKHGIKEAQVVQKTDDDLHEEQVEREQKHDPHANKTMEQLDELEDDLEDAVLAQYRSVESAGFCFGACCMHVSLSLCCSHCPLAPCPRARAAAPVVSTK